MLYKDFLKIERECPFCEKTNRIIKEEDNAFLTYSLAPYHKHHLLVVPTRHTEFFEDLNDDETKSIEKLLHFGVKILKSLGYKDYTILVRNGENLGKSVRHLHYHIVPVALIGDVDHKGYEREIMTEKEIEILMNEFKVAEEKI